MCLTSQIDKWAPSGLELLEVQQKSSRPYYDNVIFQKKSKLQIIIHSSYLLPLSLQNYPVLFDNKHLSLTNTY